MPVPRERRGMVSDGRNDDASGSRGGTRGSLGQAPPAPADGFSREAVKKFFRWLDVDRDSYEPRNVFGVVGRRKKLRSLEAATLQAHPVRPERREHEAGFLGGGGNQGDAWRDR